MKYHLGVYIDPERRNDNDDCEDIDDLSEAAGRAWLYLRSLDRGGGNEPNS